MKKVAVLLAGSLCALAGVNTSAQTAVTTWDGMTTAAAMGYCLANHPYRTIHPGPFTPDGYEVASFPGVVGTTRRNFFLTRTTVTTPPGPGSTDEGNGQTCEVACKQWGLRGLPFFKGVPLRQEVPGGIIPSGVGDLAHQAAFDVNFYTFDTEVAAMYSTSNKWHTSDVAQADYCCCHMVKMD
jgi:hypothetical protein